MSRLKGLLIAERGERCEHPGGGHGGPIELHHSAAWTTTGPRR